MMEAPAIDGPDREVERRRVSLQVLCCNGCGAPVSLEEGDHTTCRYCGARIEVPAEYLALRDTEREAAANRIEAQALYKRLGRPPGILLRLWGFISIGRVYLLLWPFAFILDGVLIVKAMDALSRSIRANVAEVLTNAQVYTLIGAAMYLTLGVPLLLGVYGRRRTNSRRVIQAALAALPPSRPGGPSRCRECGAPLNVATDALGQQCFYCGTDNLVAMPEPWIADARAKAKSLGNQIETVAAADRRMRDGERRSLRNQLLWLLLIFPPLFGFGKLEDRPDGAWPPSWQKAVSADRQFVYALREDPDRLDQFVAPPIRLSAQPGVISFDPSECGSSGCVRSYLIALRDRETLWISLDDLPEGVDGLAVIYNAQSFHLFGDDWREVGEHGILFPHKSIQFNAPSRAWFKVDIVAPKARTGARVQFRAGISPNP